MYQLRSDNTVVTQDIMSGQYVAYRLRQDGSTGLQKSMPLASATARATWNSSDTTVVYDSTASTMLAGAAPKSSHGFLGFMGGLGLGGMLLGGVAGWLGGALLGTVAGHLISTGRSDVKMKPVLQVK